MRRDRLQEILDRIRAGGRADSEESERLEIKPWPTESSGRSGRPRPDRKRIDGWTREYAVCFANAKGGELLLGIRDDLKGPDAIEGCSAEDLESLKRTVYEGTRPPLTVEFEVHDLPDGRFLVMVVPESPRVHATTSGRRLRRVGKDCQIVYPDQDLMLEVAKGGDFTAKHVRGLGLEGIDPLEMGRLRDWLSRFRPGTAEDFAGHEDAELLATLGLMDQGRPTVAALLLVGRESVLKQHLPQAEVLFLRLAAEGEPAAAPVSLRCGLLRGIERVWELIQPSNPVTVVREGLFEIPVPAFPEEVVREALLNALVHRSYVESDSVNVRVHPDRLEIGSPGGFTGGVTPENILTHEPVRRNPLLAEAFQQLGVVNRAGIGVDRMFRGLLSLGKPPPAYRGDEHSVTLIVEGGDFDDRVARLVGRMSQEGHRWTVEELIVLRHLTEHDKINAEEASRLWQRTASETSRSWRGWRASSWTNSATDAAPHIA